MNNAHSMKPPLPPLPARRVFATLPDEDREWLRARVAARGVPRVALETGLSRNTIERALAGLGLYPGSRMLFKLARERLGR